MSDVINGFNPVLSNMGALIALSALNTEPTSDDILGELESLTGLNVTVNNIDTTSVSSSTGMSRLTPTYKVWGNATITVFKNNANFKKIFNQFFGYNTSERGFYCDLTISWPKLPDWNDVHDLRIHGYLSGFNWSDITKDDVQKITFNFQPSGNPEIFYGFSSVTSIVANPSNVDAAGGNVVFTVTGTNLIDGLLVKGFVDGMADPLTIGYTTGTGTSQTVTVTYPANNSGTPKEYIVKVSTNGGITYSDKTTNVTVEAAGA